MPEHESWPGQIDATEMLFDTAASSKQGPRCYQHGKQWQEGCSWCEKAERQDAVWEENKRKAALHEEKVRSGEWSVVNLAIALDDYLFGYRSYRECPLSHEELLAWALKLACAVRTQASDVNYPLVEAHGQEVLKEFRAVQSGRPLPDPDPSPEGRGRLSALAERGG